MRTSKLLIVASADFRRGGGVATHIKTLEEQCSSHGTKAILSVNKTSGVSRFAWIVSVVLPSKILGLLSQNAGWILHVMLADLMLGIRALVLTLIYRPDCVNFHGGGNIVFWWFCSVFSRRPSVVLTVHGYLAYESEMNGRIVRGSRVARKILMLLERASFSAADRVLCVDSRLGRYVTRLTHGRTKPLTIPNAVGVSDEETHPESGVIFCPRMLYRKNGVAYAVLAMRELPGMTLFVAGDGPARSEIESLIASESISNVVILGLLSRTEMVDMYKRAQVVLIPSCTVSGVQEATSLSALEAMSWGIPVVASDIGGLREIITDGVDGILVPEKSPSAIAQAVLKIANDEELRRRIARTAKGTVAKRFGLDSWFKTYETVLFGRE